jgi:UDP-sugar transporter A1/2/3
LYLAISNLPAAVYQVVYQLKILSTAIFSVVLLGKIITRGQWLSLVGLASGVAMIQYQESVVKAGGDSGEKQSLAGAGYEQRPMLGLIVVLMACCTSGFAGVYFERLLKGSSTSLWMRNIQLAIWGTLLGFTSSLWHDFDAIVQGGFFQGYNGLTWLTIFLHALGGIAVALVVRYANSIMKGFATSVSIIVSSIVASVVMDFQYSVLFVLGTIIVLFSVYQYGLHAHKSGGQRGLKTERATARRMAEDEALLRAESGASARQRQIEAVRDRERELEMIGSK